MKNMNFMPLFLKFFRHVFFCVLFAAGLSACYPGSPFESLSSVRLESEAAVLWTDRPEFTVYAELFNHSQNRYKVEVRYLESPSGELAALNNDRDAVYPDIVIGSWLKSASTRSLFKTLDSLLDQEKSTNSIDSGSFYGRLLELGRIDGAQYLLPVSFNIPALVFNRENAGLLDDFFTIDLSKIEALGGAYNTGNGAAWTRMGFSPSWNADFLFTLVNLYGAGFREASPLSWEPSALEEGIRYLRSWTADTNGGVEMEDDFSFKYFYEPPAKLVISGRILFTYMESEEFFTLIQSDRDSLDFRWIARDNVIPLAENTAYLGLCRKGSAKKAAEAWTSWFYSDETQRLLLEEAKNLKMNETSFGIAGGFSAKRTVTEQIFPLYYAGLLGHMPPSDFLSPPNILPRNWTDIKEQVILPYLTDRIRSNAAVNGGELERRLAAWIRQNRG
jgi:ABC-type glycerol-3-phosphate transport system substrate-binding protein